MSWRDLLVNQKILVTPWTGGRELRQLARTWTIEGRMPAEYGWYTFSLSPRTATLVRPVEPIGLPFQQIGYLAGDRLVPDDVRPGANPLRLAELWPKVYLLEPGDRFQRVTVGRTHEDGPLVYLGPAFPLGPEEDVRRAFEDDSPSVDHVKGVTPALDMAFRFERHRKLEAERRRIEAERLRLEREAQTQEQERRNAIIERLGDAAGRREMAQVDFGEAARAALAVSGARYLDHRVVRQRGNVEYAVRFSWLNRRFECVVDGRLQVIDSGICLTAHYDDPDFDGGTRGDTWFTLESLPSVIKEADDAGRLVVYRH